MQVLKKACLAVLILASASVAFPLLCRNTPKIRYSQFYSLVDGIIDSPESFSSDDSSASKAKRRPHLIFPGGGLYFYWQAGVVTYLREQGYNLSKVTVSGASAGALTATLMAANVDFYQAAELALNLASQAGVWERSAGLQGIWGDLIFKWLDQLLPDNAVELVGEGNLYILVTPVPSFGKTRVSAFESKRDLIECNMASVHLPWFLDGRLTSYFRMKHHIDGSFLAKESDYFPEWHTPSSILRFDWNDDPAFTHGSFFDFITTISPDEIWRILEQGKEYARLMEANGGFKPIPKH